MTKTMTINGQTVSVHTTQSGHVIHVIKD